MEAYKERVCQERRELHEKISKLRSFIDGEMYQTLPADEKRRLNRQNVHMDQYLQVLDERIAAF